MGIINKNDKVLKWRYKAVSCNFISGGSTISIPSEKVQNITIEENFEEFYFPLIKLTLVIDSTVYYKILDHKNDCKVNLRIDKYYYSNWQTLSNPSVTRNWINGNFDIIMDDNTEDKFNSLKEDENLNDFNYRIKDMANELNYPATRVSFFLFKPIVANTKININKLFTGINVADAIAYVCSVANIDNLVMCQPDNTKVYETLLLPPLSVLKTLEFIDMYYGIYSQGTLMWFGIDHNYIIPFDGQCRAYVGNESQVTNIIIPKSTNLTHAMTLGNLKRSGSEDYILADYTSLKIENKSISGNYISPNDISLVDSYSAEMSSSSSGAISKTGNFVRYLEDKTENPLIGSMYTSQSKARSTVVTVNLEDFDVNSFTPNKRFNVLFEDPRYTGKYSGNYILSAVHHTLMKNGEDMVISSTITLKKM